MSNKDRQFYEETMRMLDARRAGLNPDVRNACDQACLPFGQEMPACESFCWSVLQGQMALSDVRTLRRDFAPNIEAAIPKQRGLFSFFKR